MKAQTELTQNLTQLFTKELCSYRGLFEGDGSQLIKNWPNDFELSAWYAIQGRGGHQGPHIHANGWVSGVLYLETIHEPVQNEGAIEFSTYGYDHSIHRDCPRTQHQPRDGDIILFPSSLFHQTIPIQSDQSRRVIAFDLRPKTRTRPAIVIKLLAKLNPVAVYLNGFNRLNTISSFVLA